ncbi:hypothetical protein ONE63_007980 [Megalurothrips usitatus]|uniref:Uncharacterized protein n=1 Tax=Megalurothrips usitatus TaxID=439358 RepID=A0AAV7XUA1_9NEOP|nr:hypothetical protein ONE63_007980 [Megalurothrips usitatus]
MMTRVSLEFVLDNGGRSVPSAVGVPLESRFGRGMEASRELDGQEAGLDGLEAALGGLMSEQGGLVSELGGLEAALGGLVSELGGLEAALGGLVSELGGLEAALGGLVSEQGGLVSELGGLEAVLEGLDAELEPGAEPVLEHCKQSDTSDSAVELPSAARGALPTLPVAARGAPDVYPGLPSNVGRPSCPALDPESVLPGPRPPGWRGWPPPELADAPLGTERRRLLWPWESYPVSSSAPSPSGSPPSRRSSATSTGDAASSWGTRGADGVRLLAADGSGDVEMDGALDLLDEVRDDGRMRDMSRDRLAGGSGGGGSAGASGPGAVVMLGGARPRVEASSPSAILATLAGGEWLHSEGSRYIRIRCDANWCNSDAGSPNG